MTARVLVVQHEDRVPLARFSYIEGVDLHVVRPDLGEQLPATAHGYDGLLVLGGTMAAWEDDVAPWLPATRALLSASVEDGTPTLGICLGAQLLALATGGRVERGPDGPELGVLPVELTPAAADDAFTRSLQPSFLVPQGHHDAVTALPTGAVLLARSAAYEHQVFRVGERAWGVQYHPEVDRSVFDDWMSADAAELEAAGSSHAAVMARFDKAEPQLARTAEAHAGAFAAVVLARASTTASVRGS